jgi:hypothetical protein
MSKIEAARTPQKFSLNAAADLPDLRDRMYEPALVRLPETIKPRAKELTIRNQGEEGACTGFALASVIDLLNCRTARGDTPVSTRMLYEMARRFDEWTGEDYDGSSLRGAIRGWWHNGVCSEADWPYKASGRNKGLTVKRAKAARAHALGAYYRLRPNLTDFHAALTEAGALCASARVHDGWFNPNRKTGLIEKREIIPDAGHAFAIVGYDTRGFIVQNSWGRSWGKSGTGLWLYEDWGENIMDAWVFRLAVPTPQVFDLRGGGAGNDPSSRSEWLRAPRRNEIAGHFVHIDDGRFRIGGRYHSELGDVEHTAELLAAARKRYKHLLFYAHGGLNSPDASARRIAAMKDVFKANGIYPFHFMYDTGLAEELKDVILSKSERARDRVGSFFDRTDRVIERLARKPGTIMWNEMKRGAKIAFNDDFAGYTTLDTFANALRDSNFEVHLVGHSTGGILLVHLLRALDRLQSWTLPISSCSLLAPASTIALYDSDFAPRLKSKAALRTRLPKLQIYNLTDKLEREDTVTPLYRKSLLYLVSNAFEGDAGMPLLGMQNFTNRLKTTPKLKIFYSGEGPSPSTESKTHGGFDNDETTMNSILRTILGAAPERKFVAKDLDY